MTTPSSITIGGVRYVPEDLSTIPNKVSVWYMHDNHTFTRLGGGLEAILRDAKRLGKESPYGLLCPVILLHGERELRRLKESVSARKELCDTAAWEAEVRADPDALRLIEAERENAEKTEPTTAPAAADCAVCVTVTFLCAECGEFDVTKSRSTLAQSCGCGRAATPIQIVSMGIKRDGAWLLYSLLK